MTCLQNFAHYRRLLAMCAVSAVLHLLVIAWLARPASLARRPPPHLSPRLSIHLSAAAPARSLAANSVSDPVSDPLSNPVPNPVPNPAPNFAPSATNQHASPARATAPRSSTSASAQPPDPGPATAGVTSRVEGWNLAAEGDAAASAHRPGYQAVQAPPNAVLSYAIQREVPGQAPADGGAGRLEWHADDSGYRLSLRGVMGELDSRGLMTDSGFGPLEARARVGTQTMVTSFDWAASRVSFDSTGAVAAVTSDGQDRASMLMRLAGLGLAGAAQLNGTLELLVAGTDGVALVRFERIGEEVIETALGKLATVHLVQVTQPGSARLDVWLAPSRSWYPVQLRVTAPDGSALTQTVTSIAPR